MPKLTDKAIQAFKPDSERDYKRFDELGLFLLVTKAGGKLWRQRYTFLVGEKRKEKLLTFGAYPEVGLREARERRDEARRIARAGIDPGAAKKSAAAMAAASEARAENTFEAVALEWINEQWADGKSPRHVSSVKRRLEVDVFPEIGSMPVADIKARDLGDMAKKVQDRGARELARRCYAYARLVLSYAVTRDYIDRNPATDVPVSMVLKSRTKAHFARIGDKDLGLLLRKISAYPGLPTTRAALQLITMCFPRTTELIEATWEEFDLDSATWTLPARRMKSKREHIIPLPRQAVDVLRCLQENRRLSEFVFPNERDHERPASNGMILAALRGMGYANVMTGHGFRGLASTLLHEAGWPHAHIEMQLAHIERDPVSGAYNSALYLKPRRLMLQRYADALDMARTGAGDWQEMLKYAPTPASADLVELKRRVA